MLITDISHSGNGLFETEIKEGHVEKKSSTQLGKKQPIGKLKTQNDDKKTFKGPW